MILIIIGVLGMIFFTSITYFYSENTASAHLGILYLSIIFFLGFITALGITKIGA